MQTHHRWVSTICDIDVYDDMDTDMNGHLTFLEWLVILATTIYILWRTCL